MTCLAIFLVVFTAFGLWSTISISRTERLLLIELLNGEGYGIKLADRIFDVSGKRLAAGTLYPALRSLEDRGLVAFYEVAEARDLGPGPVPAWMRRRNVYYLTPGGRAVANGWLERP